MSSSPAEQTLRIPLAALLAWLIPGLGHIYLGHRRRGLIFLVAITLTFWGGILIGGVRGTVDPTYRKLWFMAQLCTGSNTLLALGWHHAAQPEAQTVTDATVPPYSGHWLGGEVGVHYTGVAGLLNLLVILDAILRADAATRREESPQAVRDGP